MTWVWRSSPASRWRSSATSIESAVPGSHSTWVSRSASGSGRLDAFPLFPFVLLALLLLLHRGEDGREDLGRVLVQVIAGSQEDNAAEEHRRADDEQRSAEV